MLPKHEDSKFKKWLDILQQESWQLELIISGVAIFGLIQTFDPIVTLANAVSAKAMDNTTLSAISSIAFAAIMMCLLSLTICLIIHVILRGLWIGAVGLRYFSGDIDYEVLNYTDKFKAYLKKRIGSFDKYISKLEDYCSLIFALSFLLVFFFLSFFISIAVFSGILALIGMLFSGIAEKIFSIIFGIFMSIAFLMTAIDFFTQGFLKKKKWLAYVYFPIYRVMSRVTFSFLYRPLLYNLLDNKLGKRILAVLIPVFIVGLMSFSINIKESNFHIDRWNDKAEYARVLNYDDEIADNERIFVNNATIPSKIIKSSSLPIFIKHRIAIEDVIYKIDSTLIPKNDDRGYELGSINFQFDLENKDIAYAKLKKYLEVLKDVVTIKLDSTVVPATYIMTHNRKGQRGYETVLDLKDVSRGVHILEITRKRIRRDSISTIDVARIPFWYYLD
ncbi:hypothetical protein ACFO3O_15820 [Dokdonia ponticola]|uniref:Uncharacterized protein n=1 Tax=Dokdonia ponticola TaxID=2041041 RepID=A0ABV9HYZ8_9FLAO